MSDNAMNIPDDAPSDVQEESPTSLFILQRGATRREVNASEARHFVQGILSRSINLATLIGSGASTPAIPLMGETFRNMRADLNSARKNLAGYTKSLNESAVAIEDV